MNDINFTRNLVKGKIAELVFAQMLRNTEAFTVLEFGYEHTLPQLAHMRPKSPSSAATLDTIKHAPDFTIIDPDSRAVTLVEVKYMKRRTKPYVKKAAEDIQECWTKASLFIVSPDGFFFDDIETIIENKGAINNFVHPKITAKTQASYLKIVNEHIST